MYQSDAVTKAASAFEARWTMLSLKRVDEELYEALAEQRELYYQAMINGASNDQDVQEKLWCAATPRQFMPWNQPICRMIPTWWANTKALWWL